MGLLSVLRGIWRFADSETRASIFMELIKSILYAQEHAMCKLELDGSIMQPERKRYIMNSRRCRLFPSTAPFVIRSPELSEL